MLIRPLGSASQKVSPRVRRSFETSKYNKRAFPEHWKDCKHEPDGAARDLLFDEKESAPHAERLGRFRVGPNDGEAMLKREMNVLIQRCSGIDEAYDDVTGAQLVSELVVAARKLEMKFFKQEVWTISNVIPIRREEEFFRILLENHLTSTVTKLGPLT